MSNLSVIILHAFIASWLMSSAADAAAPHWISVGSQINDSASERTTCFEKSFLIDRPITSAVLRFVGESVYCTVEINEKLIVRQESYDPLARIDVINHIGQGNQNLKVRCRCEAGPSAFFCVLDIRFDNESTKTIVSDETWDCDRGEVASNGKVDSRYVVSPSRRVKVDTTDNYDQWKQAKGAKEGTNPASFEMYPDFEIQLIRSAADDEDSWVSLTFDPQGRLIIAKEKKGLLRMQLSDDGTSVTQTDLVNNTLLECRGLVFIGDVLYANANNSKALYRIGPDKVADSLANTEVVFASKGGVGHGRNDLAVGPDGKIYSIHGDAVKLPTDATDWTSPHRDARHGKQTSEGHLLRIDPENGDVEILAAGLRNPFGVDFNARGDVFTYDADAEFDMGAPWYRPTRVNHIVTGGDYGWRGVTKTWPPYYPEHADNARPNLDIGKGSPTAVKFGTKSNFPKRFRDALFVLDWTYGRIIAVHTFPMGASYRMTGETFLQGRPLNVTDLDFAPNGDMYFVTGGRQTQSALYRVRYVGDADQVHSTLTPQQIDRRDFANQSREKRIQLESALAEPPSEKWADLAIKELANPDPWIQHAARNLLERQPAVDQRLLDKTDVNTTLLTILTTARWLRQQDNYIVPGLLITKLSEVDLRMATRSQKLMALKSLQLAFGSIFVAPEKFGSPENFGAPDISQLEDLYPDHSFEVNQILGELLVQMGSEKIVPKTIDLLNVATDPTERMQHLFVLRNAKTGWNEQRRRDYFAALASTNDFIGGAGMNDFLKKIRAEVTAGLTDQERTSLAEWLDKPQQTTLVPKPTDRKFIQDWTVENVLESNRKRGPRDLVRGKRIFNQSQCVNCHRCAGDGNFVGPDLTAIGRRFNQRDVLTSIIEPSRVIAEKYKSLQVITTDGDTHLGQVVQGGDYRSTQLRLAPDPTNPLKTIEIEKSDIEIQRYSKVSWMPKGLLNTFTRDEILDLLAYLNAPK